MRAALAIVALLASCAPLPPPTPAPQVAGYVLVVQGGRLVEMPVPIPPDVSRIQPWEGAGSHAPAVRLVDGELSVDLTLDVLGSMSPFWLDVRLVCYSDGSIDVEVDQYSGCHQSARTAAYSARDYGEAAGLRIFSGDAIGDLLARLADGFAPQDLDTLRAKLSMETATVSILTAAYVAVLDNDDWRIRDEAMALLSDPALLPQLRAALATLDISENQRKQINVLLAVPAAGKAILAATGGQ